MKEFSTRQLAYMIKADCTISGDSFFTDVSIDSRTIKPGDCFFAIPGENFDGHNFVEQAFEKGAVCSVVNKGFKSTSNKILKVNDTVKALGLFAHNYRCQLKTKVVAITGSVGKTTARHITFHILSQHYKVFQSPRNFNNNIGLPITLLKTKPQTDILIAELGSNRPGEISYLTKLAMPDIAVVTNISAAHLEGFGNIRTIAKEKLSIAEGLRENGVLILNGDRNNLKKGLLRKNIRIITFGKTENCNIRADNILSSGVSSKFTIDGIKITIPLPGTGNIENALAAWAICRQFGIKIEDFSQGLKNLPPLPMRAELLHIGSLTVLNDCYNANPASMKNALNILKNLGSAQNRRTVFICGDMAELGTRSAELHVQLGNSIAGAGIKVLFTVGDYAKTVSSSAGANADYNLQTESFEDVNSICNKLKKIIKDYDIILVKGSRIVKLEAVLEKLRELFQ